MYKTPEILGITHVPRANEDRLDSDHVASRDAFRLRSIGQNMETCGLSENSNRTAMRW